MLNDIVNSGLQPTVKARENVAKPSQAQAEKAQPEQEVVEPTTAELQSAVSKLNDYVQNVQRTLSFSVEENTGTTVVQVYDSETEELIRQIPAEETIKLAASIEAQNATLLLKEQA
ncbi:flagellar protein FlaG [Oceanicoccus sp. KOV_DT_Chl]|uniref:flagellar protein FlaG n=1 Tax=Oceanicoccus sp. KOV_DT_Chl TaxID=1904639 RepID=UPI000C7D5602|nr:flagellar protein FlaG [Oceanicoccus sp. KOV_DT_Chl]